ncbi:MAG: hypothetical protein ACW98Y_20080, partial [Candidatus Thorarchaeota archaeon]
MKPGQKRDLTKILILVPLAIASALLAIGFADIVSLTNTTRVGVNSLLAYWAAIPASAAVLSLQKRYSKSKMVFGAAFIVPMFIRINNAIGHIVSPSEPIVEITTIALGSTLVELGIISVLLLIVTLIPDRTWKSPRHYSWIFAFAVISILHFLQGTVYTIVSGLLDSTGIIQLGLVIGSIAIVAAILTITLNSRIRYEDLPVDKGFFVAGLILVSISALLIMQDLSNIGVLWIYAENLEMAALLMFGFSLGIPLLKAAKYPRKTRYPLLIGLMITTYFPMLVTTMIESSGFNYVLEFGNILA